MFEMIKPSRTEALGDTPVCLVSCVKDEIALIGPFLDHYRRLGVRDLVLIDNGSTDGTDAYLAAQDDVTLYRCDEDFAAARGGMDWIETLLRRHASGRWGLYADCDEHLVFPHMGQTDLPGFARGLEASGHDSCRALMIDMYHDGSLADAPALTPGADVYASYNCFDADYVVRRLPKKPWTRRSEEAGLQVLGGPRTRLQSSMRRELSGGWLRPMLCGQVDRLVDHVPERWLPLFFRLWPTCLAAQHKQPLNVITDAFGYATAHDSLNRRVAPTLAALLHFKFVSEIARCRRTDAIQTQYHRRGMEREQLRLAVKRHGDASLSYMGTRRYRCWADLAAEGLIGEAWADVLRPDERALPQGRRGTASAAPAAS